MQDNIFYRINPSTQAMRALLNCGSKTEIILQSVIQKDNVDYNVEEIADRAFSNLSSIESIQLPASLKSIGKGAFTGQNIINIEIPDTVEVIGKDAFADNPIQSISLGLNVKSIGDYAFYNHNENCNLIVTNKAISPIEINEKVFADTDLLKCTLLVPSSSIKDYKKAPFWNLFGKIEAINEACTTKENTRSRQIKSNVTNNI